MGDTLVPGEQDYVETLRLSQESQHSLSQETQQLNLSQDSQSLNLSQESTANLEVGVTDGAQKSDCAMDGHDSTDKVKKKDGTKKVKKKKVKKSKDKDKDCEKGEKSEKKEKRKSKKSKQSSRRPEPEGGNTTVGNFRDEYDRIIYSNVPMFSDLEMSDEESKKQDRPPPPPRRQSRLRQIQMQQQQQQNNSTGIFFPCPNFSINSNTMIKFAIIGTELQNIARTAMRRVWMILFFRNLQHIAVKNRMLTLWVCVCMYP